MFSLHPCGYLLLSQNNAHIIHAADTAHLHGWPHAPAVGIIPAVYFTTLFMPLHSHTDSSLLCVLCSMTTKDILLSIRNGEENIEISRSRSRSVDLELDPQN